MDTSTPPESGRDPATPAAVQGLLHQARELVEHGDVSAGRLQVEQVRALLQANHDGTVPADMLAATHALWLRTLSDLMVLLEEQGEYQHALPYARDLCQHDPVRQTDVRRLTHLYVLGGSRAFHLSMCQNRFRAAQRGNGSLVLIRGVAGIGKSSFAGAVCEWAQRQGAATAVGRCYEHGIALPMAPWQEALQALSEAAATNHDHLPAPFGREPPPTAIAGLITQVATYLEELTAKRVSVLLLDDLHWADHSTLDLLEYVTRRVERLPLLILATYRSDDVGRDHPLVQYLPTLRRDRAVDSIHLHEFEPGDTSRYIECHLGPCQPNLARYLHQRSDGHPLFLTELLRDLAEHELLYVDSDGLWSLTTENASIPVLLRHIIMQRVAKLGQECEALLDVAAVMGEIWSLSAVEALLGWTEDHMLAALERSLSAHIIEANDARGERYRFAHSLIREALYRRQLPRRRRRMHGRIADHLETISATAARTDQTTDDELIGELAHHAFCAEQWQRAYRFGREAANRASQRHALHGVLQYGRQALTAAAQEPEIAKPDDLLELHEQLGYTALRLGRKDETLDSFTQMLAVATETDDRIRVASAMFRLAEAQERTYEHDRSAETRRMALELVTDETAPTLLARYHFSMAHHGLAVGELDLARHHLPEAELQARAAGDEQLLLDCTRYRAYLAIFEGEYGPGERMTTASLLHAREVGDAPRVTVACWQLGFILIERGEYERAHQLLLEGLEQASILGEHHYYVVRTRNLLGYLHRELGDVATATRWNQKALDTNPLDGSQRLSECACYSLVDMAANHLAAGRPDAAEDRLREFASIAADAAYAQYRYGNRAQLLRAELALVRKEYELALAHATEATEVAERIVMKKNIARGLLLQGRALHALGRGHEATAKVQRAVQVADDIGHAALRWQTRLAFAEIAESLGRNADGPRREAVTMVTAIADKLHARPLRDVFLNSPLVVAVNSKTDAPVATAADDLAVRKSQPAGLTPRETEVLKLVAAGLTDRQIGEQLHIALRTVNTHVTNILNKTGCDNRTAAAAFAVRHGLTDADSLS